MSSSQPSNFQSTLGSAVTDYSNLTGQDLATHPLASRIHSSNTPDSVLAVLEEQVRVFQANTHTNQKLISLLRTMIGGLYNISSMDVGPTTGYTPSKLIFSAMAIVLQTASPFTKTGSDFLIDLFESIEHFMGRLQIYNLVQLTPALRDILAKILAEILHVLATATIQLKRGKITKIINFRDSSKEALKRLDRLTLEETRITVTQTLEAVCALTTGGSGIRESMDGIRELLAVMQETLHQIHKIERDQFQQNCRRWLSAPDPWTNHNAARKSRLVGTANWFIHGATFDHWNNAGSLLWIYGIPGSGKSVLCSTIIQEVLLMRQTGLAAVAFFSFDHQDATKLDAYSLLASLIVQLCDQSDNFHDALYILYQEHDRGARQPEEDALIKCLMDMIRRSGQPRIYIILDALDECPNSYGSPSTRERVLEVLEEMIEPRFPNLRLCVTSRPEIDIRRVLMPLTGFHVILQDEGGQRDDIAMYVRWVVHTDPAIRRWPAEEKGFIIDVLMQSSDGMFQWASSQLETLRRCPLQTIRHVVKYVPKTLSEMYERVLQDINKEKWEFAHRIFQFLTVSARPLRVEELAEVFAIEINPDLMTAIPKYNARWRPEDAEDAVLSTCSGLITLQGERIVRFSHYSVREFLTSDLISNSTTISNFHVSLERAHTFLARACVSVLLKLNRRVDKSSIEDFPLASYAARHWVTHAQFGNVSMTIRDGLERLFTRHKLSLGPWIQILDKDLTGESPSAPPTESEQPDADPLYYAALFGFYDMAKHLLDTRPYDVHPVGGYHMTPLHAALAKGHVAVARLLLTSGANVNARDGQGQIPLHIAAEHGDPEPMRSLIDRGSDSNAEDDKGETPLGLASRKGKLDAAKLLLGCGANVKHEDSTAWTPLHRACDEGRHEIVLLLLKHGADPSARDYQDSTPLHQASRKGELAVVQTLLDHHADVNAQDKSGWTPLHCAIQQGNEEVVQLLLERGADVNHQTSTGWFPLHRASSEGYHEIALLLLEYGADPTAGEHRDVQERSDPQAQDHDAQGHHDEQDHHNTQENDGSTPLHQAAHKGELAVVRALLARGVKVDPLDKSNRTPLHRACDEGRHEIVLLLLKHGADLDARDCQDLTPLHQASRKGELSVVRTLLDHHADVEALDKSGCAPLHCAIQQGNEEVVQLLLEHGAAVDHQESTGWTPLHRACAKGHDNIVKLLIKYGAEVDARDKMAWTPLLIASKNGHQKVILLLLDSGADLLARNRDNHIFLDVAPAEGHVGIADVNARYKDQTVLYISSQRGDLEVIQRLIDLKADTNVENEDHETPLFPTSRNGMLEATRLLLDHSAKVDHQDLQGRTPLHWASENGRNEVIELLLERGANVDAQQVVGWTPLHLASQRGKGAVARVLLDRHAKVDAQNDLKRTSLHVASQEGHLEVVELLLTHKANVNLTDEDGETALHLAAYYEHAQVVEVLLKHNANPSFQNNEGKTPLDLAEKKGHEAVSVLLKQRLSSRAGTSY